MLAIALVASFVRHCRLNGWANRPEYATHINSGLRAIGWTTDQIGPFLDQWARDYGGTGPLPFGW